MADSVTSGKHGSTVSGEAAQSLGSPHYLDLGTQYLCDLSNTKI